MASDITPQEFFKKHGVKVKQFKDGLLGFPSGELCEDPYTLDYIPRCGEPYKGAFQTVFCNNEQELMIAIATAAIVANNLTMRQALAGCI